MKSEAKRTEKGWEYTDNSSHIFFSEDRKSWECACGESAESDIECLPESDPADGVCKEVI